MNWLRNNRYVPWHVRFLSLFGYWEPEHEFRTCPTGERHCPHLHYKLGRPPKGPYPRGG